MRNEIEAHIKAALSEVMELMKLAYARVSGSPEPGSALDQAGLFDGDKIVLDYLRHGEAGLALEHLIYMVSEPQLPISSAALSHIQQAGGAMNMDPQLWSCIRAGDA
jgi:hypothetical protein